MNSDFVKYHQQLSAEFQATQDQIRDLIGDAHWPTDGERKEVILRKVLRDRLPESIRVGRGFFCDPDGPSNQLDVLVTSAGLPTLFRDGDLVIVTPDCVKAIIEVKTNVENSDLTDIIFKLGENISRARVYSPDAWAGLFIYNGLGNKTRHVDVQAKSQALLDALQGASEGQEKQVVDCVSWGPNLFSRYWPRNEIPASSRLRDAGWHTYFFKGEHKNLAPSYFIGNLVMRLSGAQNNGMGFAWFPIQTGRGKEDHVVGFVELSLLDNPHKNPLP